MKTTGLVGGLGRVGNDEMLRQYSTVSLVVVGAISEDLRAKMLPMLGVSGLIQGQRRPCSRRTIEFGDDDRGQKVQQGRTSRARKQGNPRGL